MPVAGDAPAAADADEGERQREDQTGPGYPHDHPVMGVGEEQERPVDDGRQRGALPGQAGPLGLQPGCGRQVGSSRRDQEEHGDGDRQKREGGPEQQRHPGARQIVAVGHRGLDLPPPSRAAE